MAIQITCKYSRRAEEFCVTDKLSRGIWNIFVYVYGIIMLYVERMSGYFL